MQDSVQAYLNEIARFPLLTPEQEIQLSRQVEAMQPLLDKQQLNNVEQRIMKRGIRAKQKIINCNLRLVVHLAKKYMRRLDGNGMEFMDLVQEGAFGLTRAVELFDSTKGYKFSTYAYWWIRQAITRGIDTKERLIRVPQHGLDKVYKIMRLQRESLQTTGSLPSADEMAEVADVDLEHLQVLLARNAKHRSLDDVVLETGTPLIDVVIDEESADRQNDYAEKDERAAMYEAAMHCLTDCERDVIKRRYGLTGEEPMTLSKIAEEDGVSRERARQRIQTAHTKMRLHVKALRLV